MSKKFRTKNRRTPLRRTKEGEEKLRQRLKEKI